MQQDQALARLSRALAQAIREPQLSLLVQWTQVERGTHLDRTVASLGWSRRVSVNFDVVAMVVAQGTTPARFEPLDATVAPDLLYLEHTGSAGLRQRVSAAVASRRSERQP